MKIAQVACVFPPIRAASPTAPKKIETLLSARYEVTTFAPQTLKPWLRYGHGAFLPQLCGACVISIYLSPLPLFRHGRDRLASLKLFCRRPKLIVHYHMDVKSRNLATKILSGPDRLIRRSLLKQADRIVVGSLDYVRHSQIKILWPPPGKIFRDPFRR